jgi:lanthanide-dependent methanol dehydrogenase
MRFALFLPILLAPAAAAQAPDDGQWTMPAKNYASTRYSGLAEITAGNAKTLRPVWTFSTGVLAGHEGQPLVVKNTMYVVTPYPNVLYAFDLTQEGYPRELANGWTEDRARDWWASHQPAGALAATLGAITA